MAENGNSPAPRIHPELTAQLQRHLPFARTELQRLPGLPGLALYLINPDFPQHELTPEQMHAVLNYPAYWAFCWASGQVLARYLARNADAVRGQRVLDFGCGSGVAGIAAALAGAREVVALDIDPDALAAAAANGAINGVMLEPCADYADCSGEFDLILVADVLYDRENLPWLDKLLERAPTVLMADSRIRDFSHPGYHRIGVWRSSTWPDLDEAGEFRNVSVYLGGDRGRCLFLPAGAR
jgi:predicted nicotinamide N-methyase